MLTRIRFPIGDWSGDGHGEFVIYVAETAMSLDDVREAHLSCVEKIGFDIGDICRDNDIVDGSILSKLKELGCLNGNDEQYTLSEEDVFELWLSLLNEINPSLELRAAEQTPSVTFGGVDSRGCHLNNPGYGCFR